MRRWSTVGLAVGAICLALVAAVWAIHSRGRSYPKASGSIPSRQVQLPAAEPGTTPPDVTTDGTRFMASGQPVQLRGYDVGVSSPPIYDQAAELSANFVRITVPWSEIEPTKPTGPTGNLTHHWNTAELDSLDREVQDLGSQGVQVLIDFHQFHWSPYFAQAECKDGVSTCRATGVPSWFYEGRYPDSRQGESSAETDFWTTDRKASLYYYSAYAEMMARRYSHDANVIGYEIFNEPHSGHLPDTTATTNTILSWENQIYKVMHAVDPARTMFVMCRGGGEGIGTANLAQFGSGAKIALDFHDYYNGEPGTGMNDQGDDWVPSWAATHNQNLDSSTGYTGSQAAQAAVLQVPIDASTKAGIPMIVGEWGIHADATNADVYTNQMLSLFQSTGVSFSRWVLSPGNGFNLLTQGRPHEPNSQALQMQTALAQ